MSEGELKFPEWQAPLQEAILEFDPAKLQEELKRVEGLIQQRIQDLSHSTDGPAERLAIDDALSLLRIIKRDRLQSQARQTPKR
jgi:hypothetical protein